MKYRTIFIALLCSSTAFAQSLPIETIPSGEDKIVPLQLGEKVPFDGQLFDPQTALRWANWLQQYKLRLKQDVTYEQKVCEAKLSYSDKVLKVEEELSKEVKQDLRGRLMRSEKARLVAEEETRNPPWYRSVWFGIAVGTVGTISIFGLSVWVVSSAH